jgi:hypothetical protein
MGDLAREGGADGGPRRVRKGWRLLWRMGRVDLWTAPSVGAAAPMELGWGAMGGGWARGAG